MNRVLKSPKRLYRDYGLVLSYFFLAGSTFLLAIYSQLKMGDPQILRTSSAIILWIQLLLTGFLSPNELFLASQPPGKHLSRQYFYSLLMIVLMFAVISVVQITNVMKSEFSFISLLLLLGIILMALVSIMRGISASNEDFNLIRNSLMLESITRIFLILSLYIFGKENQLLFLVLGFTLPTLITLIFLLIQLKDLKITKSSSVKLRINFISFVVVSISVQAIIYLPLIALTNDLMDLNPLLIGLIVLINSLSRSPLVLLGGYASVITSKTSKLLINFDSNTWNELEKLRKKGSAHLTILTLFLAFVSLIYLHLFNSNNLFLPVIIFAISTILIGYSNLKSTQMLALGKTKLVSIVWLIGISVTAAMVTISTSYLAVILSSLIGPAIATIIISYEHKLLKLNHI